MKELRELVKEQADDDACWFLNVHISEAYLQQELRRMHTAVEALLALEPN